MNKTRSNTLIWILLLGCISGFTQEANRIPNINGEIQLDGRPDEPVWSSAFILRDFKQLEPDLGGTPSEASEVKIFYNRNYLYVAAAIHFSDPSQIFATMLERDVPQAKDDYFEIHLDTYNDKTNALVFRTNPLGTRQDFEVSRNGEEFNMSWNTFWDVKTSLNSYGWSCEMRIPFSSLRFREAEENTMRIKAVINYKLKGELLVAPLNNTEVVSPLYHFSNAREIQFTGLPATKPLYITPYVKANVISENRLNASETGYLRATRFLERKKYSNSETFDKILSNLGIDVKYKPTPSQTFDFTLNTDFAEVEADDRVVNISRFPIFLPEKRVFFLENADLFNSSHFNHRLFHSRRIGIQEGTPVPIIGGVRYIQNEQKWQYGLLSMQTHKVDGLTESKNMSVARARWPLLNNGSNIGVINTNILGKDNNNHLVAFDANIRFTDIIRTQFTAGVTFDKLTGNWKPMYGLSLNTFKPNGFGVNYRFREYTEHFNPELGFVSRPNTKRLTFNNGWRKTYTQSRFLRFITIGHYFTKYWLSSNGKPEFFQTNIYLTAIHKKGSRFTMFFPIYQEDHLYQTWNFSDNISIPQGSYRMWKLNPVFSSGNARAYKIILDTEFGEFYGGNQFTTALNVSYDVSKQLKTEMGGTFNQLRFPQSYVSAGSRNLNLSRYFTRVKFNFSPKSSLNTYFQYDTRTDKIGLNIRFRYNMQEGTDLYMVYNHNAYTDRNAATPRLPFTENQIFIIKYSKTFLK